MTSTGMTSTLTAAFADPVADAQRCFRAVLDAMARPGTIHRVHGVTPPAPLNTAAAAVLLTLADNETPIWLDPAAEESRGWLAFHCGAVFGEPAGAMFAVALSLPDLDTLDPGTYDSPETAATLVLRVAALGQGTAYRLRGPGLRTPAVLRVDGLPAAFAAIWQRNRALFPRGIDIVLCAGDSLACLPRSITVEEA